MALRIEPVVAATLEDWRRIHNVIIPTAPLSSAEVEERLGRHHLTLAYADDVLVGNATVRPPTGDSSIATVIVRVLPGHRRQGHGSAYLSAVLEVADALGAQRIETVVLTSNEDGLTFALNRGFIEFDRYVLDGETVPFVDLHLGKYLTK